MAKEKIFGEPVIVTANGVHIQAKSAGQQNYLDTMRRHVVTFGIGAAGTGKTFLAVAQAAYYLRVKEVRKIILTRPAVEAGERLGFLPGDMQEKVDPYLRPLYDALKEIWGFDLYQKFFNRGVIEIAPLAYMRGRTLAQANENVFDAAGLRGAHGYHGRPEPNRFAARNDFGLGGGRRGFKKCQRRRDCRADFGGRCAPRGCIANRRGLRKVRGK